MPEDPYLYLPEAVESSERHAEAGLPSAGAALEEIQQRAGGKDLVGVYASGAVYAAHRSSLGQTNWFDSRSFNFDWSFYHTADKAVKSSYAGFTWDGETLQRKIDTASRQLEALKRDPKSIQPDTYRVYLAPAAVHDLVELLSWGGFGLKAQKTQQSPLLQLAAGDASLHESVRISEHTAGGIAPDFQAEGFRRPAEVPLVEGGQLAGALVSPRSAKEYGVATNGASATEVPESLEVGAGGLPEAEVLERLGTGPLDRQHLVPELQRPRRVPDHGHDALCDVLGRGRRDRAAAQRDALRRDALPRARREPRRSHGRARAHARSRYLLRPPAGQHERAGALVEDFRLTL